MKWLRDNPALALGISLPLLLMLALLGIRAVKTAHIPPPAHGLVFSVTPYSNYSQYFTAQVNDLGKIAISFKINEAHENAPPEKYITIYKYDPADGQTQSFKITAPTNPVTGRTYKIEVPAELAKLTLSRNHISPDGYQLDPTYGAYGNVMTDIFGYRSRHHTSYVLTNDYRRVAIPGLFEYGYFYFIGWINNK